MMLKTVLPFYKYLISSAIVLLMSVSMLVGQTIKTVFFEYQVKEESFKGSFQYKLETRQLVDILKTGKADFTGVYNDDLREIYLKIVNIEMASVEHRKVKLFFDKRWRTTTSFIEEVASSRKTFTVMTNRPKSMIYKASKNGAATITVGYSYLKKTDVPQQLTLNFNVVGIGADAVKEEPAEIVEPKPAPEPVIETVTISDDIAWKNTTRSGRKSDFEDFIKGYPKSDYVPAAQKAITQLQEMEKEVKEKEIAKKTDKKPNEDKQQTPEEVAWIKAKRANNPSDYETFIINFPESELVGQAKRRIALLAPLQVQYVRDGNKYLVSFQNAENPKIIEVFPDDTEITMQMTGEELEIVVGDNRKYTFTVKDEMEKEAVFEIDNGLLPLTGTIRTEGKHLVYDAAGGIPPYSVAIKDANGIVITRINLSDTKGKINFKTLDADLNGVYTIDLLDSRKNESATFQGIVIRQDGKQLKRFMLIIGLALGLGILLFTVRHFYSKVHTTEEEDFDFSDEPLYEEELVEEIDTPETEEIEEKES